MNILKIHGTDVCSLGIVEMPAADGYEEVVFIDKASRYYKKCVICNDRLVGAILIGDKSEFLEFRDLISNQTELSEKRLQLLRSGSKAEPLKGRLVCSCAGVGVGNLQGHIAAGCTDMYSFVNFRVPEWVVAVAVGSGKHFRNGANLRFRININLAAT